MPPLPTVDPTPVVFWGLTQKALFTAFAPAVLTGLLALLGAWVGFGLANKGRKYDIFYKERYKGFEEIAGYLYKVIRLIDRYYTSFSQAADQPNYQPETEFIYSVGALRRELLRLEQPNEKYVSLLAEDTRNAYYDSIIVVNRLVRLAEEINNEQDAINMDSIQFDRFFGGFISSSEDATRLSKKTINLALRDIDLPKR